MYINMNLKDTATFLGEYNSLKPTPEHADRPIFIEKFGEN